MYDNLNLFLILKLVALLLLHPLIVNFFKIIYLKGRRECVFYDLFIYLKDRKIQRERERNLLSQMDTIAIAKPD